MPRVRFTRAATADLKGIAGYIAADNPAAAKRFSEHVQKKCALLAEHPKAGRPRFDVKPGLRSSPLDRYIIFYWAAEDGIIVARVLHSARDIARQFEG